MVINPITYSVLLYLAFNMGITMITVLASYWKPETCYNYEDSGEFLEGHKILNWLWKRYEEFVTVVVWMGFFPALITIRCIDRLYVKFRELEDKDHEDSKD